MKGAQEAIVLYDDLTNKSDIIMCPSLFPVQKLLTTVYFRCFHGYRDSVFILKCLPILRHVR